MKVICALILLSGCSLSYCSSYEWPSWLDPNGDWCGESSGSEMRLNNVIIEKGCWGYLKCVNGTAHDERCHPDKVLDYSTLTCVKPEPVLDRYGCNQIALCANLTDGLYKTHQNESTECFRCKSNMFTEVLSFGEDVGSSWYVLPSWFDPELKWCEESSGEVRMNNVVIEKDCWGYVKCVNGTTHVERCHPAKVLDFSNMTCVKPEPVMNSCNRIALCQNLADGLYTFYSDTTCTTECFRCENQLFVEVLSCGEGLRNTGPYQSCEAQQWRN